MAELDRTPTLDEVIRNALMSFAAERASCFVARVESYNLETQRASVMPAVRQFYGDGSGREGAGEWRDFSGVLLDIPVVFPSFGPWVIHAPLVAGDYVVCVVSTRSIDEWIERGGVGVEPSDLRVRMADDALAFPGVWPNPGKLSSSVARAGELVLSNRDASVQIRLRGSSAVIEAPDVQLGAAGASDPLALAGATDSRVDTLRTSLNSVITALNALIATPIPVVPPQNTVGATRVKGV